MKKIGFDIDGTILMNDNKYNLLRDKFEGFDENIHYTIYPLGDSLKMNGFVPENFSNKGFYMENKEIIFGKGTFYEGFIEFYNLLIKNNYEIFYITARDKQYEGFTKELFKLNNIPYDNVYHLGSYNKIETLKNLNIEWFFEDNIKNIEMILSATNIKTGFIEAPYNKQFNREHENLFMFKYWENVLKYFKDKENLF